MKELFETVKCSIKKEKDKILFNDFVSNYTPREERHYCAYLFSWLISGPDSIRMYFKNHISFSQNSIPELTDTDYNNANVYYEYTAIRELLDLIGRKVKKTTNYKQYLKKEIEKDVFNRKPGDIQKKKPDLVFYFPDSKSLVLVEAKFEMSFEESQLEESQKYGESLSKLFPNDIINVYVTALGIQYHLNSIKEHCPSISWEIICNLLPDGNVKNEIMKGLQYQKIIHPRRTI